MEHRMVGTDKRGSGEGNGGTERVRVYLCVRPLTEGEGETGDGQGCVLIQNDQTLLLRDPGDRLNVMAVARGDSQRAHKFTFTQVFGPETTQHEIFERTMTEAIQDVLSGENRLLYTYGVSSAGKTPTVQESGREAGLLPRTLASIFQRLRGRLYCSMDLKPVRSQEVRRLSAREVQAEEEKRDSLLKEVNWISQNSQRVSCDSVIGGTFLGSCVTTEVKVLDSLPPDADTPAHSEGEGLEGGVRFSAWVSLFEIRNESLYDLLEAPPTPRSRKHSTLCLNEDRHGNPYVEDLTWVQVRSAEEAWRVMSVHSITGSHLNHTSSRSHRIFTLRLLRIHPEAQRGGQICSSELAVCDLAGLECFGDQRIRELLREDNSINTSLHALSRCITTLRNNQSNSSRLPLVVPFRDSKLTRVLQGFLTGRGHSCMAVSINPRCSSYDETLQALKFSAISTQCVCNPSFKPLASYVQSEVQSRSLPTNHDVRREEEEDRECSQEEEGDVTRFDPEELIRVIAVLKQEVRRQREEKEVLEARVREQACGEVTEVIGRMENHFRETLESETALMEERYENKINNLQKSLKRFYTEEMEERDEEIERLTTDLRRRAEEPESGVSDRQPSSEAPPPTGRQGSSSSSCYSSSSSFCRAEELCSAQVELEQCRSDLQEKRQELRRYQDLLSLPSASRNLSTAGDRKLEEGQRCLRQLRLDLQSMGRDLHAAGKACCHSTGGERLRHALDNADSVLNKQDQILGELQNGLLLVRMDLRKKTNRLAQLKATPPPAPSSGTKSRLGGAEKQHPEKRPFLQSPISGPIPPRKVPTPCRKSPTPQATPHSKAPRSRHRSPPPVPTPPPKSRGCVS